MKTKIISCITKLGKKKLAIISGISIIICITVVVLSRIVLSDNNKEIADINKAKVEKNNSEHMVKEVKNDDVIVNRSEIKEVEESEEETNSEDISTDQQAEVVQTAKAVEVKSQQQTESVQQPQNVQQTPKQTTYISNNFKLAIDFPANWENKYTVVEDGTNLMVCLKNVTYGDGLFFLITNDLTQYDNGNHLDRVGGKREVVSNGVTYTIGAYPGMSIGDEDPNFQLYLQLSSDVSSIVSTIRAI